MFTYMNGSCFFVKRPNASGDCLIPMQLYNLHYTPKPYSPLLTIMISIQMSAFHCAGDSLFPRVGLNLTAMWKEKNGVFTAGKVTPCSFRKESDVSFQTTKTHTIHGTGIFTYLNS